MSSGRGRYGFGRKLVGLMEYFDPCVRRIANKFQAAGNPDGIRFYRELGWHDELVQMVWDTSQHEAIGSPTTL